MVGLMLTAILAGCGLFEFNVKDKDSGAADDSVPGQSETDAPEGDADADGDADSDADGDGDSDSDSDADGDTDWDPGLDCDASYSTAAPGAGDCLTGALKCGDVITATTQGGSDVYDGDFYSAAKCFVPFTSYDGPERVYEVDLPADVVATISLSAPCSDHGIAFARWEDDSRCPNEDHTITSCEGKEDSSGAELTMWSDRESRYLLIVDGASASPFAVKIECQGT
ncbi:MAG: hypothetical protein RIT28_3848 [Pseudomonadota bacterium]|jgi:hypothetical protein